MSQLLIVNSGLRLMLEVSSLLVLLWIGFTGFQFPLNGLIGVILPMAFIVLWSIFIAPASKYRTNYFVRFIIEICIFSTVASLISTQSNRILGVSFFIFSFINTILNHIGDLLSKRKAQYKNIN